MKLLKDIGLAIRAAAKQDETQKIIEKARQIIGQLAINTEQLAKNDIASWRAAHQMALNVENPRRLNLYKIYDFTTDIDAYVSGIVERIKYGIMQRRFKITDGKGNEDEVASAIFRMPWFWSLMSLFVDTGMQGNSLVQLGDMINTGQALGFSDVQLIPRRHVMPEFGVILPNQSDDVSRGIPYRQGPYAAWLVEMGDAHGLGKYLKITPHVISKKYAQIFWDNFAERFGVPIIYATTNTRDASEHVKIQDMLSGFGNNTWGLFGEGTKLELLETNTGDAFRVYDQRIIRANKEISIGLAGQTMAFDDGSSLSQAQVHDEGFQDVKDALAVGLKFLINFQLIPKMIALGFPLKDRCFEWDDSYEYTPTEMRHVEQMLLDRYKIDPKYFASKYNIPITGEREDGSFFE
ncbi:MAG: DUF935 domain-containing protein [Rikenellaceae bacterium]|jgi:hypothetical protein|nr:DUF935 domain-containing protein [Rikenellaceae bacterium]